MTQRRPDTYTSINTNTQRTGLPSQSHKIVFLTSDTLGANAPATQVPVAVYDSAGADKAMGTAENKTSIASRMVDTALKVSQGVDMSVANKDFGANNILCVPTSISVRNADCEVGKTYVLSFSINHSEIEMVSMTAEDGNKIDELFIGAIEKARHFLDLQVAHDSEVFIIHGLSSESNDTRKDHSVLRIVPSAVDKSTEVHDMYDDIITNQENGVEVHSCSVGSSIR